MTASRPDPPLARIALACLLAAFAATLAGCGVNRPLARRAEAIVQAARPQAATCDGDTHCAIESPYRALAAAARASPTPLHYVTILERGEDALLMRVHLIRAATRSIDVQTFIWADDDAGRLVLDELVAAARRGVRVRVLADQLFSLDDVEWLARLARAHENFRFRLYNPTFDEAVTEPLEFAAGVLCCFSRFNQRMHNKLLLVDGDIGIAGGRNVEDRYFDWDPTFDYRDRDVLVAGPEAGREMQASFDRFWSHPRAVPLTRLNDVNRRLVRDGAHVVEQEPAWADPQRVAVLRARAADAELVRERFAADALAVAAVDYFSDAPDKAARPNDADLLELTTRISGLLRSARETIEFETPYLVLSGHAREIFHELQQRPQPVRVRVSTNSLAATDAFYVYALSYKYKKRYLKRYGFEIHEFKPFPQDAPDFVADYQALAGSGNEGRYRRYGRAPLVHGGVRLGLHAKSIVIDGRISVIGSHNFDPRSDDYNTESGFIIDDARVAARLRSAIERNMHPRNAWTIAKRPRPELLGRINNVIADLSTSLPLFDLWPFRYASSFQLREGCEPARPGTPAFYACYDDVGDFPEVDLPLKTIYTRMMTAFGAGLAGIL